MKKKFTEEKLENVFIELIGQEGYPHTLGTSIPRSTETVLLEEDLKKYLKKRYSEFGVTC